MAEYDEVEKLKDQLELAEASKLLEEAREAMHGDRTDEDAMKTYREESQKVSDLRVAFRQKYPPPSPEEGDALATVETVEAPGGVHQG